MQHFNSENEIFTKTIINAQNILGEENQIVSENINWKVHSK